MKKLIIKNIEFTFQSGDIQIDIIYINNLFEKIRFTFQSGDIQMLYLNLTLKIFS